MHSLGETRSSNQRDHLLHTPDTFVRAALPGMVLGEAVVHISPAGGAGFTQYTAELQPQGCLGTTSAQRFVYVMEGNVTVALQGNLHTLAAGGFAYLSAGVAHTVAATVAARLAVIEKPYQPLPGASAPTARIGQESEATPTPLMGDPDLVVRGLLPGDLGFDFAVNTMTYQPGAALSMVEVHVMEHGLLMLEGGGIYRLSDRWYPVRAGDFIWMGPYCPQWFGALGKVPAKYLIYKDWNRHPLP
ncbi:MAG: (S)-ureidoglycine aminohydrolase [Acidobacteriota bacterium]|nr:(S)-ureidoglycine aminohydrolase [Acidobacteriota bacterium]